MGDKRVSNPNDAFGSTGLENELWNSQGTFVAGGAITAKYCVAIATDGKVAVAATNGTAALVIGIAQDAIASAATGNIVLAGVVTSVPVAGAVAAGDTLKRSATTAGYLSATATPAVGEGIAVALAASASNVASVWVRAMGA